MIRNKNIDWYRHLSFAAVGGFFAAYAVLLRMGVMANAQTLNLLELLISILRCNWLTALMHVGAAIAYFSAQWLELSSSLCALPLIALAYYMVVCEERYTPSQADTPV